MRLQLTFDEKKSCEHVANVKTSTRLLHNLNVKEVLIVVVCRLHYVNTLKQELDGTRAYLETDTDEVSVVNAHLNDLPVKFSVCVNEGQDKLPTMYW